MVQVEIQNDKTSLDNMPKILLRAQRQQHPPSITKEDMRLDRTFAPGTSKTLVPRAKHIIGYKGFQRGNKCKEVWSSGTAAGMYSELHRSQGAALPDAAGVKSLDFPPLFRALGHQDLGNLERTAELETLLRELSKGVNGVTLAGYDILRTTPSTSMQQELHCKKVCTRVLRYDFCVHRVASCTIK